MPRPRIIQVVEHAPAPSARLLDPYVEDYVSADGVAGMTASSAEHFADLAWIREFRAWQDDAHGKTIRVEHIAWERAAIVGNVWPEWRDGARRSRPHGPPPLNGRSVALRSTADVQSHGTR